MQHVHERKANKKKKGKKKDTSEAELEVRVVLGFMYHEIITKLFVATLCFATFGFVPPTIAIIKQLPRCDYILGNI